MIFFLEVSDDLAKIKVSDLFDNSSTRTLACAASIFHVPSGTGTASSIFAFIFDLGWPKEAYDDIEVSRSNPIVMLSTDFSQLLYRDLRSL